MKKDIHPKYYPEAKIICACGNIITTGSTRPEMKVEVCSACHPFYTGKKRLVDSAGRLDRFKKRFEKTAEMKAGLAKKQAVKGKKKKAKLVIEKKISKKKIAKKTAAKKVIKKK
ncbi:MAG: 50S ribosomal protein L31 [Candidatus Moranbacteria bacterium RIFOXYB1_FULL_43_19]|nr:MAG: 50S ribosomal protein L31 [Candidatus Moranbacteria bacterium RIFOXYB1_FULL_43_19]OGI28640.1 MAG: 50S ribosomal protein L31 [Candidatus Moranbacteria bacterium RIFOXYA1_FULL_44_7]OGI33791.1 MAG: 50S ribosomal protein L31 [Candidatus Moranbacteria bacterium RIFOXYC1_FULL_44_13]OGI38739.1 MAG: 50S ribosomal protein L31 [Candidatus Moranbacteria bacterium RIFOXYD1_FULL_44_12]